MAEISKPLFPDKIDTGEVKKDETKSDIVEDDSQEQPEEQTRYRPYVYISENSSLNSSHSYAMRIRVDEDGNTFIKLKDEVNEEPYKDIKQEIIRKTGHTLI